MSTISSVPDNPFFAEFLDDFFAECDEHLTSVRRDLLALEAALGQPHIDRTLLSQLLRSFHTLKGLSGMVGVQALEQLAHQIESYLRALEQAQVGLTTEALSALVAGARTIEQVLDARRAQRSPPDVAPLVARLAALVPAVLVQAPVLAANGTARQPPTLQTLGEQEQQRLDAARGRGTPVWRVVFAPSQQLTERDVNVNSVRERLQSLGEIVRAVPEVLGQGKIAFEFLVAAEVDPGILDSWRDDGITYARYEPPAAPQADSAAPASIAPSNVVRVELSRVDEIIRMVGDLVISRARLQEQLQPLEPSVGVPAWRTLQETATALERQLRQLRQGVMQLRMVPIGETFARMQFVVHDLARESHKQVALELQGQETAIDKFVVERMLDPLLHLVRNAVSHGLETTDERIAQGKPPAGRIVLRATTAGDAVLIDIEDDGRGIDAQRVARRSRDLGLIGAEELLDPALLLDIICAPGFSTHEQADRVSGRGVGMDVVKQTVQGLGGVLSLDTAPGRGTHFSIQLPLTLAIMDALIVEAGKQSFAVPMPAVREVVEVLSEQLTVLEKNELLPYRGGVLPLLRLTRQFGLPEPAQAARYALVVGSGSSAAGVVVDRLIGKREVVVRALADPLIQIVGLAGATELGDGRPILILDAPALARARRLQRHRATEAGMLAAYQRTTAPGKSGKEPMMADTQQIVETLVLCELAGATYGIPSRSVRQIELVEQITPVPNAPPFVAGIAFSRGQVIPAIDLRARFGFEKIPYSLRSRLIVITTGERTVGVIVDTAREFVSISADAVQPPPEAIAGMSGAYLKGIARVGERLVVLLDLDEVLHGAEILAPMQEETGDRR